MDLSSPAFLFRFLPVVLVAYALAGPRLRTPVLLLASLWFYWQGAGALLWVLIDLIALNYFFALAIDRAATPWTRSAALWIGIAANLAILFAYKYLGFFGSMLAPLFPSRPPQLGLGALPLGLSFLTFQALAYLIDVYREVQAPERNLLRFSLFMALFPKVGAGPIIRMHQVEQELGENRLCWEGWLIGAKRVLNGLGKKLIIADALALAADQVFALPAGGLSTGAAWLGIVCYSLQLYFDFSGYSDLAIGLGRMLGFELPENFDYPYTARSLTEFWRRWHLSLSTWFRDYLFIPLSYALVTETLRLKMAQGKYTTNYRSLYAILVVFTLCGLWHGASWNFVLWGMLHGVVLALESWKLGKLLKKLWPPLAHLYLLLVVLSCWVFFRIPQLAAAGGFLAALAGFGPGPAGLGQLRQLVSIELLLVLTLALVGCLPWTGWLRGALRRLCAPLDARAAGGGVAGVQLALLLECLFLGALTLTCLQAVTGSAAKQFIYAQF